MKIAMKYTTIVMSAVLSISSVYAGNYYGYAQEIPAPIAHIMIGKSWTAACPIPLADLRYLTICYWGYDDEVHEGHLVIHKELAEEIIEIFGELFAARFPIERMELIDYYNADDDRSMAANNTSAFCFRANTTNPSIISMHGYGCAIDINPLINPYVKGTRVLPEGGRAYLDRTQAHKGIITASLDNPCYRAFITRGYEWGGDWTDRIDYQHFAKPLKTN